MPLWSRAADRASTERAAPHEETDDDPDSECEEEERDHEREREWEGRLAMDETLLDQLRTNASKLTHVLHVKDDPRADHPLAQIDERGAEVSRRPQLGDHA